MDLFEYQGKQYFARYDIPVSPGGPADTVDEAVKEAASAGYPVVVKAQVQVGGRGKAGGIKLADNEAEVREHAGNILGMDIKGHVVRRLWVEAASDIDEECYVSFTLDRSEKKHLMMLSREGGVEIEEVAVNNPDALAMIRVDALVGCTLEKATEIADAAKFPAEVRDQVIEMLQSLWKVLVEEDATLVEVNPLVKTNDGKVIALDGKVTLDDNAEFRQPDHGALIDQAAENPLEAAAKEKGLNYVKLEGEVGIIGNGAGLVMSTLDVVAYAGEKHGGVRPANFLDIGGGASAQVMADGLSIILGDKDVKSVFVNVFGGITACDAVATGIVQALELLGSKATKPIVVRLDGNNVMEGRAILNKAAHPLVQQLDTMDGAADRAAELAAK